MPLGNSRVTLSQKRHRRSRLLHPKTYISRGRAQMHATGCGFSGHRLPPPRETLSISGTNPCTLRMHCGASSPFPHFSPLARLHHRIVRRPAIHIGHACASYIICSRNSAAHITHPGVGTRQPWALPARAPATHVKPTRPIDPHPDNLTLKHAQSAPGIIIGRSPVRPGAHRPITASVIASKPCERTCQPCMAFHHS